MMRPFAFLFVMLALVGCKDGLVEPERFGSIEGVVLDFESGAVVPGALVSTSPATDALQVGDDGAFAFADVATGSYTITARRSGYDANTVTVQVRDGRTARAVLFLEAETVAADPEADLVAEILGFRNQAVSPDSSLVTVEYRVRNAGTVDIAAYEVYVRVDTDSGASFYEEVGGQDLRPGERDVATFVEQLGGASATGVVIEDTSVRLGDS